ncbi:fibropellin-1-like, partial [Mercenaria mercenaria]|uniref:fibropellin-1-like n=1 Tax=Mercenaria mercenaria TaxID=6596 RepID=UPI00234E3C08
KLNHQTYFHIFQLYVSVFDPCSSNPCERGTCFHHSTLFHCLCPSGYTGKKCEININECQSQPCLNGGVCVDTIGDFKCNCSSGFVGNTCEIDVNECISQPCLNGGFCKDSIDRFLCQCRTGFDGDRCQNVFDPCSSNPCERGTCFHHSTLFHCLCPSGYTGKKCEININECQSQPCLNGGVCVDTIGDFKCNCSSGFVGNTCEIDVNECISQPCLNGGFCKDSIDRFLCQCITGFDGDRCQNVVDPCMSSPCIRGICFSHGLQFLCECPSGFTGKLCETTIQLTLNGPKEKYLKVPAGSELVMNCSVSGIHPPKFHWSKVNACGIKYENITASVYRESHASLGDAGTYVCTGSDGYGPNVTNYFHVEILTSQENEVCNFDDGTLCGWVQEKSDSFDWTFQSGPTQSDGTGPDVDHTLGTLQGKYVYIESSSQRKFSEHASLLSHVMPANRTMCFEFWYYMFGDGSGRLFVLVKDTCLRKETQLFEETGNQGAQWNKASVTITDHFVPNDYIIVLKADVGSTFHGDTAVDDLVIYEGSCRGNHGVPIVG